MRFIQNSTAGDQNPAKDSPYHRQPFGNKEKSLKNSPCFQVKNGEIKKQVPFLTWKGDVMKRSFLFFPVLLLTFLSLPAFSQDDSFFECTELTDPYTGLPQRGGRYFTEQGVVRALVVFVQFAGDTTNPNNGNWPVNQPPIYWKQVLDSTLTPQNNDDGSLSQWFREMSFNKLQIYGDAYFVITDSTKQWYIDHGKDYGDVNKDVLIKLDSQVDYSLYDNWKFEYYSHKNVPDSTVDLIIIIYRENVETEIFPYSNGIAQLGFSGNLIVDGGSTKIKGLFPGSGVFLEKGIWGKHTQWQSHEIGHLLMGAGHPGYNKDGQYEGFWGILFANSYLVNAHDRHWLRWVDVTELQITDSLDISVSDYLTSGDAYRIALPGTNDNEAFFIENHQELSYFDNWVNWDGSGKGLYIYHVYGNTDKPSYDVEIAEGRFNWSNPYWIHNPWNSNPLDSVPVFAQGTPNRFGYDGRDAIPTTKGYKYKIYVTDDDQDGNWDINRRVFGSELDAFKVGYNEIFSPWSNPNSNRWDDVTPSNITIEILGTYAGVNGEDIYNLRIRMLNGENGPPSNPLLLSMENYSAGGNQGIKLTWAANLEPDIAGYEVFRQKNGGTITKISGSSLVTDTTWINWGVIITDNSPTTYTYYVKAVDTQNKRSNYSNSLSSDVDFVRGGAQKPALTNAQTPASFSLSSNYPNPFNPETAISYQLPANSRVNLTVYNLNGQMVRRLVNENQSAGSYTVKWDGRDDHGVPVSSGVYFYRLTTGSGFVATRKMVLLR